MEISMLVFEKICKEVGCFTLIAHKTSLQSFKPIIPVISWIFGLKCHGQTSLEVVFFMFGLVFVKFRKLKTLYREHKKLDLY